MILYISHICPLNLPCVFRNHWLHLETHPQMTAQLKESNVAADSAHAIVAINFALLHSHIFENAETYARL